MFHNKKYYNAISHSKEERISNENIFKNLYSLYLSYLSPNKTEILILYKDGKFENGVITDNLPDIVQPEPYTKKIVNSSKIRIENHFEKKEWSNLDEEIFLNLNNKQVRFMANNKKLKINDRIYYKVEDLSFIQSIILVLTMKQNEQKSIDTINQNLTVNPDGFGKCTVYKNFNYNDKITLG